MHDETDAFCLQHNTLKAWSEVKFLFILIRFVLDDILGLNLMSMPYPKCRRYNTFIKRRSGRKFFKAYAQV